MKEMAGRGKRAVNNFLTVRIVGHYTGMKEDTQVEQELDLKGINKRIEVKVRRELRQ